MVGLAKDLWSLVWGRPEIDPNDLARAVQAESAGPELDYRTRLLIRDSVNALKDYWGPERTHHWLTALPTREQIEAICREDFDKVGFPSLREHLVEKTDPQVVQQLFREVGRRIRRPTHL